MNILLVILAVSVGDVEYFFARLEQTELIPCHILLIFEIFSIFNGILEFGIADFLHGEFFLERGDIILCVLGTAVVVPEGDDQNQHENDHNAFRRYASLFEADAIAYFHKEPPLHRMRPVLFCATVLA